MINGGGKGGKELDQQTKILLLIIAVLVAGGIYHWYQQHQVWLQNFVLFAS